MGTSGLMSSKAAQPRLIQTGACASTNRNPKPFLSETPVRFLTETLLSLLFVGMRYYSLTACRALWTHSCALVMEAREAHGELGRRVARERLRFARDQARDVERREHRRLALLERVAHRARRARAAAARLSLIHI